MNLRPIPSAPDGIREARSNVAEGAAAVPSESDKRTLGFDRLP